MMLFVVLIFTTLVIATLLSYFFHTMVYISAIRCSAYAAIWDVYQLEYYKKLTQSTLKKISEQPLISLKWIQREDFVLKTLKLTNRLLKNNKIVLLPDNDFRLEESISQQRLHILHVVSGYIESNMFNDLEIKPQDIVSLLYKHQLTVEALILELSAQGISPYSISMMSQIYYINFQGWSEALVAAFNQASGRQCSGIADIDPEKIIMETTWISAFIVGVNPESLGVTLWQLEGSWRFKALPPSSFMVKKTIDK